MTVCGDFLDSLMTIDRQSDLCSVARTLVSGSPLTKAIHVSPSESVFGPRLPLDSRRMTDAEIVAFAEAIQGYYAAAPLGRLLEFAKSVPGGGVICEIGVWRGRSAAVLMLEQLRRWESLTLNPSSQVHDGAGLKNLSELHLVDSWVESSPRIDFERLIHKIRSRAPLNARCHWMSSQDALEFIPPLDLLHVDGDHAAGVAEDCRLYLPKVKIGGVAVFHDYSEDGEFPGVKAAVDRTVREFPFEWEILGAIDNQFAAKRIGSVHERG